VEIFRKLNVEGIGITDKEKDQQARREFKEALKGSGEVGELREKVAGFARNFSIP